MIQGLTDRNAMFPEIGSLRKGAKKTDTNKPGVDLDHFRFVADTETMRVFKETFGDKPQEIRFMSPFNTTAEVFEAWKEEYAASSLKHRCDGVNCVAWLQPNGQYSTTPKPCPGGCKQTGRLKIVIPQLNRLGFVTVHTTSIWDILTIHQNLSAIEMLRGSLRGIPLVLKRVKRAISTPSGSNGGRARREKWLLSIEAAPEWVERQLAGMQHAALLTAANEPLMLNPGDIAEVEPDDENDEAEQLASPAIAAEIEQLWPEFGQAALKLKTAQPLEAFLRTRKQVASASLLPQADAERLLGLLKDAAASHPAATPKTFGWQCDEASAAEIDQLTNDLLKDGVAQSAITAELAEFLQMDRSAAAEPSVLTNEQAQAWIGVLQSWITSRGANE